MAGAIHYPRSTSAMLTYIMSMAKNNGLNTVQTYGFWNIHEQKRGIYDFSGRTNLSGLLQEAANAGLFVNLRIGPYVCAEWDYGGLPVWLNNVPNMVFRSNKDAWTTEMKRFIATRKGFIKQSKVARKLVFAEKIFRFEKTRKEKRINRRKF